MRLAAPARYLGTSGTEKRSRENCCYRLDTEACWCVAERLVGAAIPVLWKKPCCIAFYNFMFTLLSLTFRPGCFSGTAVLSEALA